MATPPPDAAPDGPEPHPTCTVCTDTATCAFHRARDPKEFVTALQEAIAKHGAVGLLNSVEASLATLTDWELNPLRASLAHLVTKPIEQRFTKILDADRWSSADLVKMAALALTLHILTEAKEAHADGPKKTR